MVEERVEEVYDNGYGYGNPCRYLQEVFRGFLRCLGFENQGGGVKEGRGGGGGGGGDDDGDGGEVVDDPPITSPSDDPTRDPIDEPISSTVSNLLTCNQFCVTILGGDWDCIF